MTPHTPTTGQVTPEIRPNTPLRNLAGKATAAADLLWLTAVVPQLEGAAGIERFEVIIDLLCDVAVDLGSMIEGLREGGRS